MKGEAKLELIRVWAKLRDRDRDDRFEHFGRLGKLRQHLVVARRLGVTTQAASEMLRRLTADGLLAAAADAASNAAANRREVRLTTAGRTAADARDTRSPTSKSHGSAERRPRLVNLGRLRFVPRAD